MEASRTPKTGVLLRVSYDGTELHGWAAQNNARTVAGDLQRAVAVLDDQASLLRGASRTDAGVHARGQLAAFTATRDIATRGWVAGINSNLPADISVNSACYVETEFNPRFHNVGKRYVYRLLRSATRCAVGERFAWRVDPSVDLAVMQVAAAQFVGKHDFRAFCTEDRHGPKPNTVRNVTAVTIREASDGQVDVCVEGEAFLYNMVRIMVGTLVDIGTSKRTVDAISEALASRNRAAAGPTAPAHGLTLESVRLQPDVAMSGQWP
jgi:tRNA pseudouridine38-40 synthase